MKYTKSLNKNFQFRYVYNKGRSLANRHLVMYVIKNNKNTDQIRLGISVSKKVGISVVRSKVTRLIKESFRLMEEDIELGYDIAIIARAGASLASYKEINSSLFHLLKKHSLIKDKG